MIALALENDAFYRAITVDDPHPLDALERYFDYSLQEGARIGRVVNLGDLTLGAAIWHFPQPTAVLGRESAAKAAALATILTPEGAANYHRIVDFMHGRSQPLIPPDAWYLSIIAVAPQAQGRGLGHQLLAPTLAEADAVRAICFLETFTPRTLNFYERLGFRTAARIHEPTTNADYALMIRAH